MFDDNCDQEGQSNGRLSKDNEARRQYPYPLARCRVRANACVRACTLQPAYVWHVRMMCACVCVPRFKGQGTRDHRVKKKKDPDKRPQARNGIRSGADRSRGGWKGNSVDGGVRFCRRSIFIDRVIWVHTVNMAAGRRQQLTSYGHSKHRAALR